ncbi:beta-L-arabinofuranosidase domain-containing protein [Mucilaginibacter sp. dw_454]|uniref:glycoside hydrolase family 127 protein n=1 Tax=Mucilaginibacter sp. dw_454 TaxID=2720079 RepID=UPI001BD66F16|nr:beta-L-arabinofuranosidase domain-containing protein [Mucilaginibacter sp. dw_454]
MYRSKVLFGAIWCWLCFSFNSFGQVVKPAITDALSPAESVHLNGFLATKLSEDIDNRLLAQDVDRLIAPFKLENRTETTLWQSEFWGKWFTSLALAYKYNPDPRLKATMNHAVAGLLATQTSDGYIGNYAAEHRLEGWDIWGRKYCMLGLLAYYDLTKDKKSLTAASRIADNLIDDLNKKDGIIVTKGNYRGMAASSVLEPICLLYNHTGNKKYLDFAQEIVRQWETPEGPHLISKANINVAQRFPKPKNWYSPEQGQKAYEMMSCYEGLLELYRITGNETYKHAVEDTWANIKRTEIDIVGSGASTEMWFGGKALENTPINHFQETCVTITWLKLTQQLLRLTGEAKYADEAERTYYNALLGSMSQHGAEWAKYTPLNGERLPGSEQCGMGLNCCIASGPRGLFAIPLFMAMETAGGLQVNYFADGSYKLTSPKGQAVTLTQHTDYPKTGVVNIDINLPKPEDMTISTRIPAWSAKSKLIVNGTEINGLQPGSYAKIKRTWKTGDKITLEVDMRGRVVQTGTSFQSAAIVRGPLVLARDTRFESTALTAVLRPVADKNGYIDLTNLPDNTNDDILLLCKARFIPESYTEVPKGPVDITLCDYASAGNGTQHSFYAVWWPQLFHPDGN